MNMLRVIKFGFDSKYIFNSNKVHDAIYRFSFSGYREGIYIKRHINTRKYGIEINRYDNK